MSSHREAPGISKDPAADNTDTYAFVTDEDGNRFVNVIASYLPAQNPAGGPNFYEFDDDVLYEIKFNNDQNAVADVIYQFRFTTEITNPNTFLYNTGPIDSLESANWNRKQTYSVTRKVTESNGSVVSQDVVASGLISPPCNIGPRSTPDYASLAEGAVHALPGGGKVFAGQRADSFYVDLGSVFDLGALRPFQNLHLLSSAAEDGEDTLQASNVLSIALQLPVSAVTKGGVTPTDAASEEAVVGVWATAARRKGLVRDKDGVTRTSGPWVQVSRLGNPLFNEVIVPMSKKDTFNAQAPIKDKAYAEHVNQPELAVLLPVLYPGVFPNLAELNGTPRADLNAILLTGIPSGIVPGFQNYTGPTESDMLRLNVAIAPSEDPNKLGLVGGDAAGFPNGRRLGDDVVSIELRAVAGLTYPLIDPSYEPDGAAGVIEDGTSGNPGRVFLDVFPYIGIPYAGYEVNYEQPSSGMSAAT